MTKNDFNASLLEFLNASPTPFHVTENMKGMLSNMGFKELQEENSWDLEVNERYFVIRNDSSIIAFNHTREHNYTIVGAHTDSPNLKLKPRPVVKSQGSTQLGVEKYGGALLNPWFDRDLGLAGRINYTNTSGELSSALINVNEAIAVIPSLAIHLDSDANKNRSINAQTDIVPLICSDEDFDFDFFIKSELTNAGVKDAEAILSHELNFYDVQRASYVGVKSDYIASARLDNLLSCYVALMALVSVPKDEPFMMVCSDHEEVGSESQSGAAGSFLESTLRRLSGSYEAFSKLIAKSLLISADNAHAIHPNYASKHEPEHAPKINQGVVIKTNANQRYTSNSTTVARFKVAASRAEVELQDFVTRGDMGCGSTIGPITATRLGLLAIDIGLPTYAMHSIRELCGKDDAYDLFLILLQLGKDNG